MTALFASNFFNSSLRTSLRNSSMTVAFPFPFDLDCVGLAYCTFCVALVVQRASSLPRKANGPGTGTVSCDGRQPMYSAMLYQLQKQGIDFRTYLWAPPLPAPRPHLTSRPLDSPAHL
jgi:hypothetical protein